MWTVLHNITTAHKNEAMMTTAPGWFYSIHLHNHSIIRTCASSTKQQSSISRIQAMEMDDEKDPHFTSDSQQGLEVHRIPRVRSNLVLCREIQ